MATITTSDFKKKADSFIDEPLNEPVYITKHGRRIVVLIDAIEFERLITNADNRQSYFTRDLPADAVEALEKGPQSPDRPELDHLMKNRCCLLYTSPSPRDATLSRMPSSA